MSLFCFAQDAERIFTADNGAYPWFDSKQWTLDSIPDVYRGGGPFPQQSCASHSLEVPGHPVTIVIGVCEVDLAAFEASPFSPVKTGETFNVRNSDGSLLAYMVYRIANPPATFGDGLSSGLVFLKIEAAADGVSALSTKMDSPEPPPLTIADPSRFDIYLLIGQSNMLGRDIKGIHTQTPDPQVGAFSPKGRWIVAIEPIGAGGTGFGPGTFFAVEMRKADPSVQIGLVQCAVGGTPLSRWVKGADLYENAVRRVELAMQAGILKGVLWHQGESDSSSPTLASSYEARLKQMFENLRVDLGSPDLPIVVGQLGEFVQEPYVETVRSALRNLPHDLSGVGFADSQGLSDKGDQLHFSVDSQHEMGVRYAVAMGTLLQKKDSEAMKISIQLKAL